TVGEKREIPRMIGRAGLGIVRPPQQTEIAAPVSCKKHLLSCAASSFVSGGTRRVFHPPARGALVISANAEQPPNFLAAVCGSTTQCPLLICCAVGCYPFSQR